jgi:hypothetical protein
MLKNLSRAQMTAAWCGTVVTLGAISVVAGTAITVGNGELLAVACLVPPAIMLLVWRGPPPLTVAELLHDIDTPSKDGRS